MGEDKSSMGNRCCADKDGDVKPATSTNQAPVLHQPPPSEGAPDISRLPRCQADSAALEAWRNVPHLQFQALLAATTSTRPVYSADWRRRNALVNCFALVCKDWWQAVAPAEGSVNDNRLQRRIRLTKTVTAAEMRPWWTTLDATNTNIDDAVIIALAEHCPALTDISVDNCKYLTNSAIIALAEHCPTLISVDVSNCKNLTDAAIIALAEHCLVLTRISVISCTNLTDAAIIGLAERCPALTNVDVRYCWNLTDAAIIALAEHCPALTEINVRHCRNLTDAAIIGLAERCPALTYVGVRPCHQMTNAV